MSERANELEYEGEEIYSERKEENKTNNNNKKHTENIYIRNDSIINMNM